MDRPRASLPPSAEAGDPRRGSGEGTTAPEPAQAAPARAAGTRRRRRGRGLAGLVLLHLAAPVVALWRFVDALPPLDLAPAGLRSTVVLDRDGRLLRPFATADGRWRLPVTGAQVDPRFRAMLMAYEDRRFARHPGIDPVATLRAAGQWLAAGRIVSGGSTLSMQVARLVEPRAERSLAAKLRQMVRAVQLEQRLGKDGVLDLYLALAPYGGPVEGLRAASLAYFGREPARLSFAESALLVALPQAPEARRPDRFPGAARRARDRVLAIATAQGVVTAAEAEAARTEPVPSARKPFPMLAAHAAEAAHAADPGAHAIRLTLDGRLQASLETLAAERAAAQGPGISAALLALDNRTGAVLAQVGSPGYLDASRAGAIDMTGAIRSPGSALKPFIYALAFETGLAHPETQLDDRPVRFAGAYAPENFDLGYQGSVTARRALQLSLNVPAVDLLEGVGPARLIARLRAAGARIDLPRDTAPGLPVALGGLGITLTDLARLFAGLARQGLVPNLTRRVGDASGGVSGEGTGAPPQEARITEAVAAWYVADILRGAPPPENALAGRIAYKTGTSYGYRDALAVGFDRRVTLAVWVGRPDGNAVPGLVGRVVAAPILFDAFARFGGEPDPVPMPHDALVTTTAGLPPPLRHIRRDIPKTLSAALGGALKIAYPPDGARIDLGLSEPEPAPAPSLALKALGGVPPLTWMVDGLPVAGGARRQSAWAPDGAGFARISVMDATGASDSVMVRLE
ncbi:penicillin-binding protein 1C [Methylobacterium sp. V23]|uniref:penicillin-binding protein 1C n=1 Tax=Methylobacterium sp. V23 TaxID=2044878 RepID=UPI001FE143CB|nr:penicillin-binding protein 1C [Methylobacterium sp. V23]